MDTTKIIVENWPNAPWYKDAAILISVLALVVTLYSLYQTRTVFINSVRPFVNGNNFGSLQNNIIVEFPSGVLFRVKNAPAKIISMEVEIKHNNDRLFYAIERNLIRFPDDASQWHYIVPGFDQIVNAAGINQNNLTRIITLKYSSLDGGKIYNFKLGQSLDVASNTWRDTKSSAD